MALSQVWLAPPLDIIVSLLTGCDGDPEPVATEKSPAQRTTAATRPYTEQELEKGLLPPQLPGFERVLGQVGSGVIR
jgi:hypothetical protein